MSVALQNLQENDCVENKVENKTQSFSIVKWFKNFFAERSAINALERLNDAQLKDIGLSRSDISTQVRTYYRGI